MQQPAEHFAQLAHHDHADCIRQALQRAEEICRRKNFRLTPLRRRVLELIWRHHRPVGAYQLLEELPGEGRAKPPTIYRTLEFLQRAGLVHRLATLNAYIGCPAPGEPAHGPFLICSGCRTLVELAEDRVSDTIRRCSEAAGFAVTAQVVEIHGLCPACQEPS